MRNFAGTILTSTLLLSLSGCSPADNSSADESRAEGTRGHLLQAQQDALDKAKGAAAALEAAAAETAATIEENTNR